MATRKKKRSTGGLNKAMNRMAGKRAGGKNSPAMNKRIRKVRKKMTKR